MNETWRVPLADIAVDDELAAAGLDALRSGWWSMGPRVAELEQEFAAFCGTRHALAVSSGTAAIHLALLACGCGPGDEVILPSLNFVAAANCVLETGATPVFCDVRSESDLNLDAADVASLISARTKALLVLHYGGYPCDLEALTRLAADHGLALIEDAAHAPGASWQGRPCGSVGSVGCFSLFANKNLPSGEGGMVVTDDDEAAHRMRLLRSHGMTTLTWDRHQGHASSYDVVEPGFNYRLDELRAALALVGLRRLDARNTRRADLTAGYRAALAGVVPLAFESPTGDAVPAYHLAVAVLPLDVDRDGFRSALSARGVQTSVHYPPIHRFRTYRSYSTRRLPVTERLAERIVTLPLFAHMTDEQLSTVVEACETALTATAGTH